MPEQKKPNILFIMADDIGWFNISCNNNGIMGYRTPTSTVSRKRARTSPIAMASRAAPAARRSSPASNPSAPA